MRCKGTTASFIICKSGTSLHLSFDFFIPKIRELHGLLQGTNSPCSLKFSMMCFNPSLTSGFSGQCFLCGNKWVFELDNYRNSILCSTHRFSISPYCRITFCSTKGREREGSIFMKAEAWTLFSIFLHKRGEGDSDTIRNSCKNSPESQLQPKE